MDTQSKNFKKLQALWDKKLKDSGFNDIESRSDSLIQWQDSFHQGYHTEITLQAKKDYYIAAEHFLNYYPFKNEAEVRIWALHSEGVSIREIVGILDKEKLWLVQGGTPHRRAVHECLQRLSKLMMIDMRRRREDE